MSHSSGETFLKFFRFFIIEAVAGNMVDYVNRTCAKIKTPSRVRAAEERDYGRITNKEIDKNCC